MVVRRKTAFAEGMGGATLIMLIATVGGGACNFFYQVMMQNLAPTDLSEINTLLAILYIFAVPATAVHNVLIRYVAKYNAMGSSGHISWLLRRTLLLVLGLGAIAAIGLVAVLNLPAVASSLNLTSPAATLLIAGAVLLSLLLPIGSAPLQGLQRFTAYGITYGGNYLIKLAMGVGLVVMGLGVAGAVGGVMVGIAFGAALSLIATRKLFPVPPVKASSGEIWRFTIPTTVASLGFTLLTNVDVILAALLMEKDPANVYAAASMLAKIILFLPGAISSVMFPKVAKAHAQRKDTWKILRTAIGGTTLMAGTAAVIMIIAPDLVLQTLVPNNPYLVEVAPVMQILALAMTLLGLANVFMLYGLATDGHVYVIITFLAVLVLFALVGLLAASGQIFTPYLLAEVMALTGIFIISLSGMYLFLVEREWGIRRG